MCQFIYHALRFSCKGELAELKEVKTCDVPNKSCPANPRNHVFAWADPVLKGLYESNPDAKKDKHSEPDPARDTELDMTSRDTYHKIYDVSQPCEPGCRMREYQYVLCLMFWMRNGADVSVSLVGGLPQSIAQMTHVAEYV